MRKPAIQRLVYCALLTLLVTATLLLSGTQEETATPIPFVHVVIDKDARGATGQGVDCKAGGDIDGDGLPDVVIGSKELVWYDYPDWAKHVIAVAKMATDAPMLLSARRSIRPSEGGASIGSSNPLTRRAPLGSATLR